MANDPLFETAEDKRSQYASPTLIIGLGGTGAEVLSRVRDRFFSSLGPLDQFPVVQYLWLDTDTVQSTHVSSWYKQHQSIAQQLRFQTHEHVPLTVSDTETYLSHLQDWPHIARWVYPHLSSKRSISEGAGQVRAYGRLAFFHNVDRVRFQLGEALKKMVSLEARNVAADHGLKTNSDQLNIILVGSVAGGTGSGTFLDMAYLVRQEVKQFGGTLNVNLMGFLAMPRVFGGAAAMGRLYANGYAALKELNHFNYSPPVERQSADREGTRSKDHDYELWFDRHEETIRLGVAPFDVTYLVDGMNLGGAAASGAPQNETIYSMIAETIFHDFSMSDFGTVKRSTRDNLLRLIDADARPLLETDDHGVKLPKRHFSFGVATITFPYDRVLKACSAKLASQVIDYWLRRHDEGMEATAFLKETFLGALGLEEVEPGGVRPEKHDVLDALYKASETGRRMQDEAFDRVAQLVRFVKEQGTDRAGTPWGELLRQELRKIDKDWSGDNTEDDKLWGHYVEVMRQNQKSLLSEVQKRLQTQVSNLINNEYRGIGFAIAVLEALDDRLGREEIGHIDVWTKELRQIQEQMNALRTDLEGLLSDLDEHWEMSNWHLLRGITLQKDLEKLQTLANDLYQTRVRHFARALAIEAAAQVRNWIAEDAYGWRGKLIRLQRDLGKLKQHLSSRVEAYSEATPDTRQILLYSGADDLARIYERYVPDAEKKAKENRTVIQRYNSEALNALGVKLLDLQAYDAEQLCDRLMKVTQKQFGSLAEDFDVLSEFHRKYPPRGGEWKRKIEEIVKACQPWVTWEQGYTGISDRVGAEAGRFILGLPQSDDPNLKDFTEAVLDAYPGLAQKIPKQINSRHQIVLYTEVAGFALCQTSAVKVMREQYQKAIADGARDLHVDKNDARFSEVVVLGPEERQQIATAARAYLLGSILGLITPKEWKDARGNRDLTYEYLQKQAGLSPEPRYLGNGNAIIPFLRSKRDLLTCINEDITWRKAELQNEGEAWAEYAAALRLWIEEYFKVRQIDVGNGITLPVISLENRVLREELEQVMNNTPPELRALAQRKFTQIEQNDGFTRQNLDGRRVLDLPAVADQEPNLWRIG